MPESRPAPDDEGHEPDSEQERGERSTRGGSPSRDLERAVPPAPDESR